MGEALIDMICTDTGNPLASGEHFLKKAGGAPTNVAAAIAALGGEVSIAAKVGADPFGDHLVQVMKDFNVDSTYLLQDPQHFTTFAFVSLMHNGERDFVFNRGADGQLSESDVAQINLDNYSLVHFGSATAFLPGPLQSAYAYLLERAQQKNLFISFDPNYRHLLFPNNTQSFIDQSWNYLQQCHFFKLSDEEAVLLTGAIDVAEAAKQLAQKTKAVFCITLGKDGTMLVHNKEQIVVPSIPVQAVDSTGAGDAFVGAVLYQLANYTLPHIQAFNRQQWTHFVTNANKAGARTCAYMGAMEAFKHLNKSIFE